MKRNLFFILAAILISLSLSQGSFAAGFENPYKIQVRRLSWFKPEYLTITYAGTFNISLIPQHILLEINLKY